MAKYFLKRLFAGVVCLLGVTLIVFIAVRATGDPADILLPEDATSEDFARLRAELGIDKPIHVQYVIFLERAARGDFGRSTRFNRPAMELVKGRLAASLQLASMAFVLSTLLGIVAGVLSARSRGSVIDTFVKGCSLIGQSIPSFWLGLTLILVFSVWLNLLPTSGRGGLISMILPALTLAAYSTAAVSRLTRSAMLNVLDSDYIRMARLKGCNERSVVWRHALKNAAVPVVTMLGMQMAHLIGHGVIVETVFAWPGIGKLIMDAVFARDYSVVMAGVSVLSMVYIIINVGVDIVYGVLDPQIRYE